jgi:hypothetical protein
MNQPSKIISDMFTATEIALLVQDCDIRPVAEIDNSINISKNFDYQISGSASNKIIKPKLDKLFGPEHTVSQGCYKIISAPYGTHIDNDGFRQQHYAHSHDAKFETAVLIPLVEDPRFCTITFDIFTDEIHGMSKLLPAKFETGSNSFDLTELDHIAQPAREQISRFNIDTVFRWKLGSAVTWHKNQLHTSTNFAKFGLVKKFIIIFVA